MHVERYCLILIFLLFYTNIARSQKQRTEISINFRTNSIVIDSTYSDNAARMRGIITTLQNIKQDSTVNIVEVSFCGAASPEGSYELNRKLARGRLTSLEKFVRRDINIPDSIITRNDSYIPWDYLKSQVENSDLQNKDEIIFILEEEARLVDYHHTGTNIDNRIVKLKQLDNGKVWQQMNKLFFGQMRNAYVVIITYKKKMSPVQEPGNLPDTTIVEPEPVVDIVEVVPDTVMTVEPITPEAEEWTHHLHLKTNALGWGLATANVAVEVDLAKHWSFTFPVYYSTWNYFKSSIKFRTFAIQPEFRYWLSMHNDGLFAGAHLGLMYYNFAINGDYRYQDHNRRSPAIGGGVSVGYRLPISRNNRWRMEFSLGAGVYSLHYDKFHNTPRTKDGLLVESVKKTYWGIDQAAVSFSYAFDLKRKGGR